MLALETRQPELVVMWDVTQSPKLLEAMGDVIYNHVGEWHDLRVSISLTYEAGF